jgi:hypothetical protein
MFRELLSKLDALLAPAGRVAVDRFCWSPER